MLNYELLSKQFTKELKTVDYKTIKKWTKMDDKRIDYANYIKQQSGTKHE